MMDHRTTLSPVAEDWLAGTSGQVGGTTYQALHAYTKRHEVGFEEDNLL